MKYSISLDKIEVELEPTDKFKRAVAKYMKADSMSEAEAVHTVVLDNLLALPESMGFTFDGGAVLLSIHAEQGVSND